MPVKRPDFIPGNFYHIYNRGNNRERLFYREANYQYFMSRLDEYMASVIDLYSYCLMPNHFHLLIKVKKISSDKSVNDIVSEHFRRCFIGYSQTINEQQGRTGSLFQKSFRRKHVDSFSYLKYLVCYIHRNPIHHNLTNQFSGYPWSSFDHILEPETDFQAATEVLEWFQNREGFLEFHLSEIVAAENIAKVMMEDNP